jgi:Myb-like DNA-binding protein FlbD
MPKVRLRDSVNCRKRDSLVILSALDSQLRTAKLTIQCSSGCSMWFQRIEEVVDDSANQPIAIPEAYSTTRNLQPNCQASRKRKRPEASGIEEEEDIRAFQRVRLLYKSRQDPPDLNTNKAHPANLPLSTRNSACTSEAGIFGSSTTSDRGGASHRRGPWSKAEDNYLTQLVHTQGALNWVRVAQLIGSRSPKQCRERYHQCLKPSLNHDPISPDEGLQIERLVAEMGKRWEEIARRLNGRSDNAVKNWWNGSMNRRRLFVLRRAPSPPTSEVSRADSIDAAPSSRALPPPGIELLPLNGTEYSASRRPSLPADSQGHSFSARFHNDAKYHRANAFYAPLFRGAEQHPTHRPQQHFHEPRSQFLTTPSIPINLPSLQLLEPTSKKQRLEQDPRMNLSSLLA